MLTVVSPGSDDESNVGHAVGEVLEGSTGINASTVRVGERTYIIQTLTAERFGALGTLLLRESQAALETGLPTLVDEVRADVKGLDLGTLSGQLGAILAFWERLPATFGKAMALMLSSEAPADDAPYLVAHLDALTILDIIDGFMDVNRWEDLIERFFRLRARWERGVARLQQGPNSSTS